MVQDHASVSQTRVVAERMVKDGVSGYKGQTQQITWSLPSREKTVEKNFLLNSFALRGPEGSLRVIHFNLLLQEVQQFSTWV